MPPPTLFLGEFEHSIDDKSRLAVPARFRPALEDGLVITRGLRDALRIATQARPRLFDRHIVLPDLLYTRVVEADERIGAEGEVVRALDPASLRGPLQAAYDDYRQAVTLKPDFTLASDELKRFKIVEKPSPTP